MKIQLNSNQITNLKKVHPADAKKGGFQGFIVALQSKVDLRDNTIDLSVSDIGRIDRYVNRYRNGGWQNYLKAVFGGSIL
jgi:hypothetical protein